MCRFVFGEVPLEVCYFYFSCCVDLQFELKFSQQSWKSYWNVKLMVIMQTLSKRASSTQLKRSKRLITTLLQIVKGKWIATSNEHYLHRAIHHLFTIFRNVSTTILKINKKRLHKQLTIIHKKQKKTKNNGTNQKNKQ